jgi:hypothetical protein
MSNISQRKAELNTASAASGPAPEPTRGVPCQIVRDEDGSLRVVFGDQSQGAPQTALSDYAEKEELAEELKRNPRTLDRWAALGTGPPRTRVGRKVYYNRVSFQKWLAAQERQGNAS